jgi:hypothetical protein
MIVWAGAQTISAITALGGYGGPANAEGQIQMHSASFRTRQIIPVRKNSVTLIPLRTVVTGDVSSEVLIDPSPWSSWTLSQTSSCHSVQRSASIGSSRDFSTHSLRDVKIHKYGIRWSHARQTIQAIDASRETAGLLGIRPGGALLFFEHVSFSQDNVPMEFLQAYYRGDRYVLHSEL